MAIRSLAAGHTKLAISHKPPTDIANPTLDFATTAFDASCAIVASDFTLGPTGSETVSEGALCDEISVQSFGQSNYEANITIFRYFQAEGETPDAQLDQAFTLMQNKGTRLWLIERVSVKKSIDAFAAGDVVCVYEVETDNPQPGSRTEGYIKAKVPLSVKNAALHVPLAAA